MCKLKLLVKLTGVMIRRWARAIAVVILESAGPNALETIGAEWRIGQLTAVGLVRLWLTGRRSRTPRPGGTTGTAGSVGGWVVYSTMSVRNRVKRVSIPGTSYTWKSTYTWNVHTPGIYLYPKLIISGQLANILNKHYRSRVQWKLPHIYDSVLFEYESGKQWITFS